MNKILFLLDASDRKNVILLILFSIGVAIVETIGISAIMPFLSLATDFSLVSSHPVSSEIYEYFSFSSELNFVIAFGFILILFYIVRSIANMLYVYAVSRFSYTKYHSLAYRLLGNYIARSYGEYVKSNSSDLTKSIVTEADFITKMFASILYIITEVFVVIFIYTILIIVDWEITLYLTVFLLVNGIVLIKVLSKKIKKEGVNREYFQGKFYEIINLTFGNFKIIKLKDSVGKIKDKFSEACYGYSMTNVTNQTLTAFPRLFLEGLGFIVLILMSIYLLYKNQGDVSESIPMLSVFVLGLYRLTPSVNRMITNYNLIIFNLVSLRIVYKELITETEQLGNEDITLNNRIELKGLEFEYLKGNNILNNIDLVINKGESVAFIGYSGVGKSTLVDIIMGLFNPKNGHIYVDGQLLCDLNFKSWRKQIGYVPQTVYLFDGTVAQNVAFGSEIDIEKVKSSLKKAQLLEFLESHHDGINTDVGEGGELLSGGQKQRVAIARALYDDPEILILDEATSSLDEKTELMIMNDIYEVAKDKTLLIIAHKLSTIKSCNKVYRVMENGIELAKPN